jgi:hypothetical protein
LWHFFISPVVYWQLLGKKYHQERRFWRKEFMKIALRVVVLTMMLAAAASAAVPIPTPTPEPPAQTAQTV